jgi:DNA repair exonuclease SbcCD nuclease subunit
MIKLLHLSDAHLDTTFRSRSADVRKQLRSALRTAFTRAIDCALEEGVDAVLIAGDLFDSERLSFGTERYLTAELGRLDQAGIACIYATGNHDPSTSESGARRIEWPASCIVVGEAVPRQIELKDQGGGTIALLWAAGHESAQEQRNLASEFPAAEQGLTSYAYWALGHVHAPQNVSQQTQVWYAGNLQGRTFRESGPRGGLLVTIRNASDVNVEFRSFAPVEWLTVVVDNLEHVRSEHELEQLIGNVVSAEASAAGDQHSMMIRAVLQGPCPLARLLSDSEEVAELEQVLRGAADVLDIEVLADRVSHVIDLDEYRDQPHLLSEVLSVIDEVRADPTQLEDLLPPERAGTWNTESEKQAYYEDLLADLEREAAARFLVDH